ncbi:alpha/beta hydrolase [Rhizomicrobium electricum]|uniref:Alpha/beta hydrolase n=1 Tax=Rhizomicrobium electricum TaxID=480070 RepID=A0ABN1F5F9_9PROT|nr:alpha/beta hydrolase [Rhizomicrobium electricum]NIJ50526.1 endo-1,4-beta-xylanase [Rhizomicrobium electricum]
MKSIVASLCAAVLLAVAASAADPILLWPKGAPGSEGKTAPETMRINPPDEEVVSKVNAPSITPFLPDPAKATGAAVIIIPGGGHKEIWVTHEGYRVAQALADRGVAAFVLKYRLAYADGSTYKVMDHSLADVQRAIRLVKSRSAEWKIDPARVGVMGFSAGGHLTALAGTHIALENPKAADPIDRLSARPAFLGLIYAYLPAEVVFKADTPPSFFIFGDKDNVTTGQVNRYIEVQKLGVPSEIHILSGVAHGFGIRPTNPPQVAIWPTLLVNWLDASGFLQPKP